MKISLSLILATSLASFSAIAGILPQTTATSFNLFLSPTGLDTNSGVSESAPLLTLSAAQKILNALNVSTNVVINIAPGTYYNQSVNWTYVRPDINIKIQGVGVTKPIFDGCQPGTTCTNKTFFVLTSASGLPSNITIDNLQIQRYWMAISLNGIYTNFGAYNWNNTISNNVFQDIGNGWNPSLPYSYAAVRLYNSRNNFVTKNTFMNIINQGDYDGYIHAIYAASYASSNSITYNKFVNVSGDVIRTRDLSNYNLIGNNIFVNSGKNAVTSDWYCFGSGCDKVECPSWNTNFNGNTYGLSFQKGYVRTTYAFGSNASTGCSKQDTTSTRITSAASTYMIQ